jgi:hypothetical protein
MTQKYLQIQYNQLPILESEILQFSTLKKIFKKKKEKG